MRVLRNLNSDLVCIQEAPRFLFWRKTCQRLSADSGYRVIGGGRSAAANLLLGGTDAIVHRNRDVAFTKIRGLSARGAALADVSVRGIQLTLVGTHLDGEDRARLGHITELHQTMSDFITPGDHFVIGVDVNAEPGSPSWDRLCERADDAAAIASSGDSRTNRTQNPHRRIDALFVSPTLVVESTQAVDSWDVVAASDHRPVVATLRKA